MLSQKIFELLKRFSEKKYNIFHAKMEDDSDVFTNLKVDISEKSKILVVYGDNATGKSLISKLLEQILKQDKIAVRNACVRNRTSSGIEKAMIYGDEATQSTGATSFNVIKLCLNSCLKDTKESVAILDEPDLGLSSRFSKSLAQFIMSYTKEMNNEQFVVITSHNKDFIQQLINDSENGVSSFGINTEQNLQDFINNDDIASIEELENRGSFGHKRWLAIENSLK